MRLLFEGLMRRIRAGLCPGPVVALRPFLKCFQEIASKVMAVNLNLPSIARNAFALITGNCGMKYKSIAGDAARLTDNSSLPQSTTRFRARTLTATSLFIFTLLVLSLGSNPAQAAPAQGTIITNTASLTSTAGNVADSANVTVVVRSPSSVELLQYAPGSPSATNLLVQPTEHSTSGLVAGPFNPSPNPTQFSGANLPVPASYPLAPAAVIKANEPLFIRVVDTDQNMNIAVADTIIVTLTSSGSGDSVILRLTETGPNTGEFTGFVQTNTGAVTANDANLTMNINDSIGINYTDTADATDTASSNILVDPYGVLFSTSDGTLLDGATVTMVNVATGLPATVFGDDGISVFPSTVTSGGSAMDSGGTNYNFPAGMYRFPFVQPGNYRLDIIPPAGFDHPSSASTATIQALPGAPYAIALGSRGENFVVNPGPALHIDVPLDPSTSGLFVTKKATKEKVSIGEYVEYKLTVANVSAGGLTNTILTDVLPPGFRLEPGSVTIDGAAVADPAISGDGRTLAFSLGNMLATASVSVNYVAAVSVGAETGNAVNTAYANAFGGIGSNTATASVLVEDDLMHSRSFVTGRVMVGSCKAESGNTGNVNLQLQSTAIADQIHFTASAAIETVPVKDFKLIVNLPEVLRYRQDSAKLNGQVIGNPTLNGKQLIFEFGDKKAGESIKLSFLTDSMHDMYGEFSATANAEFNVDSSTVTALNKETTLITPVVVNRFKDFPRSYRTRFDTLSADLTREDRENLTDLAHMLRDQKIKQVTIIGHADKRRIRKSAKTKFKDNAELSLARAKSVAAFMKKTFKLSEKQLMLVGSGTSKSIRYSEKLRGRKLSKDDQLSINRRVEVFIELAVQKADTRFILTQADSGLKATPTQGPSGELSGPDLGDNAEGIANVRLYLENGRYVDTDESGLYHFEGIRPGTHVIQIDEASLPEHLEIYQCENNTRFAGSANSRFVDIQAGGLWRTDFYLRQKPMDANRGKIGIQLTSNLQGDVLQYRVKVNGSAIASKDRKIVTHLPMGIKYVPDSTSIDGSKAANPETKGQQLIFDLGDWHSDSWSAELSFNAKSSIRIEGEYTTRALLQFRTSDGSTLQSSQAINTVLHQSRTTERLIFEASYDKDQVKLSNADRSDLDSVIDFLLDKRVRKLRVVGHTDDQPVAGILSSQYKNNEAVSLDRATKVGAYLARKLSMYSNQMEIVGRGDQQPISSNAAEAGRKENRRTEVFVTYANSSGAKETVLNQNDSGMMTATVSAQFAIKDLTAAEGTEEREKPVDGILNFSNGDKVSKPVHMVKVQLDKHLKPTLLLDGKEIPAKQIGFSALNEKTGRKIYSYIGVNLGKPGGHVLSVSGTGPFGNVRFSQDIHLTLSGGIARARVVNSTGNIADGRTPVRFKVQLLDSLGQVINVGAELDIVKGTLKPDLPYNAIPELRRDNKVTISRDGKLEFAPVKTSGTYRATLAYGNTTFEVETFVKPHYRDWILVGLAEGTAGYNSVSGNMENLDSADVKDEFYSDGRLSFYAKGKIKGKYLLTTAYDSDKETVKASGNGLFGDIQPDKYYTLYGDGTRSEHAAASTSKLYVKLESDEFYALYGDYDTDLTVTQLSNYSRSFTGLKTEYKDEQFKVNAFAVETKQGFIKNEIRGDGTSGLYYLSHKNIVLNSEKIRIETRDRFRSENILESRQLSRFVDYTFDATSGTVYFREPVYSRDGEFNPVYIVIDYEIESDVENNITAGGRVAYKTSKSGPEIGATIISEGTTGAEGDLLGIDLNHQLSKKSQIKLEIATSDSTSGTQKLEGDAYLAEINHQAGNLDSKIYFKEQEAGFGLGHQNGSEHGTRKYGADIKSKIRDNITLNAEYLHQDNLNTNAKRDVLDSSIEVKKESYTATGGILLARDKYGNSEEKDSNLVTGSVERNFLNNRLTGKVAAEVGVDNESVDYPDRLSIGADYLLTERTQLFANQEFSFGDTQDTQMTRAGIKSSPWKDAKFQSSVENQSSENGERTFSNMGLTQGIQIDKHWRLDVGFERSQTIKNSSTPNININVPPTSGTTNNDFTALSAGATYKNLLWSMTGRIETRMGDLEDKQGLILGVYHEPEPGFALASRLQFFNTDRLNGTRNQKTDLEFSLASRPVSSQWTILDKIRFEHQKDSGIDNVTTSKFINNINANYLHDRRNQLSLNHGIKYVKDKLGGNTYSGITQVFGSEYRHDINNYWDFGIQASLLISDVGDSERYSYGASIGHSFARNVWLSVGFNIDGFTDSDFSAARYTSEGIYVKFRFAFDHYTTRKAMAWWEKE